MKFQENFNIYCKLILKKKYESAQSLLRLLGFRLKSHRILQTITINDTKGNTVKFARETINKNILLVYYCLEIEVGVAAKVYKVRKPLPRSKNTEFQILT